jgi:hypothetical protein
MPVKHTRTMKHLWTDISHCLKPIFNIHNTFKYSSYLQTWVSKQFQIMNILTYLSYILNLHVEFVMPVKHTRTMKHL